MHCNSQRLFAVVVFLLQLLLECQAVLLLIPPTPFEHFHPTAEYNEINNKPIFLTRKLTQNI